MSDLILFEVLQVLEVDYLVIDYSVDYWGHHQVSAVEFADRHLVRLVQSVDYRQLAVVLFEFLQVLCLLNQKEYRRTLQKEIQC